MEDARKLNDRRDGAGEGPRPALFVMLAVGLRPCPNKNSCIPALSKTTRALEAVEVARASAENARAKAVSAHAEAVSALEAEQQALRRNRALGLASASAAAVAQDPMCALLLATGRHATRDLDGVSTMRHSSK